MRQKNRQAVEHQLAKTGKVLRQVVDLWLLRDFRRAGRRSLAIKIVRRFDLEGTINRCQQRIELRTSNAWQQAQRVGREVTRLVHLRGYDIGLPIRADGDASYCDIADTLAALDLDVFPAQQGSITQGFDTVDVERTQSRISWNGGIVGQFQVVDAI